MKKKVSVSLIIALVMTLILVSGVLAGSIGNIDGVWQYVEDNSDPTSNAFCVTYGTGNGTAETDRSRNSPAIQTPPNTDENQIHYGKGINISGDCPTTSDGVTSQWFDAQSGLGFDGNNSVGVVPADQTFLIGRLTHYNRPIWLSNDGTPPTAGSWQFMQWVDLDLTLTGVMCTGPGDPALVPPLEGTNFTFTYRINFEETPNSCNILYNPCAFGDACPPEGCSDRVTVGQAPPATSFTCGTNAAPSVQGVYTLVLDGFKSNGTSTICPTTASAPYQTQYISTENSQNNACLYGKVTNFIPAAVTLKDFSAAIVEEGVLLHWETLSEVSTLGFNLYRSESLEAEKVLVNSELIMSNLAPGSLGGALYEHLDKANTAEAYYWLEEIEADGTATSYGWTLAR